MIFVLIMGPEGIEVNNNKIYNFLNSVNFGVFQQENRGTFGIWAFWYFASKIGCQKQCLDPQGPILCICELK